MMGMDVIVFIFGASLLAAGFWGGGISIKDITIPKIGMMPRLLSVVAGMVFVAVGVGLNDVYTSDSRDESESTTPQDVADLSEPQPNPGSDGQSVSPPQASETYQTVAPESTDSTTADPDERFKAEVGSELRYYAESFGLTNYELTHEPYLGQLEDNTKEYVSLDLDASRNYTILAVCDSDCGDIDLNLYDENNNLIDSDTEYDDYPVVQVMPVWSGTFNLEVTIPNCAAQYCYYGVGVFGQ